MTPFDKDVKALARWLHDAYLAGLLPADVTPWADLPGFWRDRYYKVARALLATPPEVLRQAVRELAKEDEGGSHAGTSH